MDRNKILIFWIWFKQISNKLSLNLKNQDLLGELDFKVHDIGNFDWEIGPYAKEDFFLAISPNLDKNMLKETKAFISMAGDCPKWVFLASKPEKGWFGQWKMDNEFGQVIDINANSWRYIYEYENREFEMDIFVDNVQFNQDTAYKAVDINLTNLLVEEKYIDLFDNITIIQDLAKFDVSKSSFLYNLKDHLDGLNFL